MGHFCPALTQQQTSGRGPIGLGELAVQVEERLGEGERFLGSETGREHLRDREGGEDGAPSSPKKWQQEMPAPPVKVHGGSVLSRLGPGPPILPFSSRKPGRPVTMPVTGKVSGFQPLQGASPGRRRLPPPCPVLSLRGLHSPHAHHPWGLCFLCSQPHLGISTWTAFSCPRSA